MKFTSVDVSIESDPFDEPEQIEDNFQLEVSYAYIDRNEAHHNDYFLLDFVAFNKLAEFGNAVASVGWVEHSETHQ